jgi:mannose-6-phosphate isomerase-like protein (cupin superfamily)
VLLSGTARITSGYEVRLVTSNKSVYIALKTPHHLENPETVPVYIIRCKPATTWRKTTSPAWKMILLAAGQ